MIKTSVLTIAKGGVFCIGDILPLLLLYGRSAWPTAYTWNGLDDVTLAPPFEAEVPRGLGVVLTETVRSVAALLSMLS